jgi:GNAT superfamily N-acetyltransferase
VSESSAGHIACGRMTRETRADALSLLGIFLDQDTHYLDSSGAYGAGGEAALDRALSMFLERPELGFVWLAFEDDEPVAACVVSFAISTSTGGIVGKLDDVFVAADRRGRGIGSLHLESLKDELRRAGATRIDTSVHIENEGAKRFYERHGFLPLLEERIACIL